MNNYAVVFNKIAKDATEILNDKKFEESRFYKEIEEAANNGLFSVKLYGLTKEELVLISKAGFDIREERYYSDIVFETTTRTQKLYDIIIAWE